MLWCARLLHLITRSALLCQGVFTCMTLWSLCAELLFVILLTPSLPFPLPCRIKISFERTMANILLQTYTVSVYNCDQFLLRVTQKQTQKTNGVFMIVWSLCAELLFACSFSWQSSKKQDQDRNSYGEYPAANLRYAERKKGATDRRLQIEDKQSKINYSLLAMCEQGLLR